MFVILALAMDSLSWSWLTRLTGLSGLTWLVSCSVALRVVGILLLLDLLLHGSLHLLHHWISSHGWSIVELLLLLLEVLLDTCLHGLHHRVWLLLWLRLPAKVELLLETTDHCIHYWVVRGLVGGCKLAQILCDGLWLVSL